jgi:hypothetical protein
MTKRRDFKALVRERMDKRRYLPRAQYQQPSASPHPHFPASSPARPSAESERHGCPPVTLASQANPSAELPMPSASMASASPVSLHRLRVQGWPPCIAGPAALMDVTWRRSIPHQHEGDDQRTTGGNAGRPRRRSPTAGRRSATDAASRLDRAAAGVVGTGPHVVAVAGRVAMTSG